MLLEVITNQIVTNTPVHQFMIMQLRYLLERNLMIQYAGNIGPLRPRPLIKTKMAMRIKIEMGKCQGFRKEIVGLLQNPQL